MPNDVRIAAVDDHPMFLEGLQRALRSAPHLKLVAQGGSASEARRIVQEVQPDVLLLDIGIPGGGIAAVRAIVTQSSNTKIIMLTGSECDEHVTAALAAGAKGYLLKGAGADEVVEAVATVLGGEPYITKNVAARLLVQKISSQAAISPAQLDKLNHREKQVLECASQGMTNRDIAMELNLQVRTVKNYMSRILQKLQARNRIAAIAVFKRN